jgi:copper chaperone CopZ
MRKFFQSQLAIASVATLSLLAGDCAFAAPVEMQTVEIVAEGMCCQGCARKVSGKVYTARGVQSVSTDVPTHAVTIQAPKVGEAYLGVLWDAVAAGNGAPKSLSTAEATFRLEPAAQASQNNVTAIRIEGLEDQSQVQRLADQYSAVEGVSGVRFDPNNTSLLVTTAENRRLSPWAAAEIAVRAGERPVSVTGAAGVLTIEWLNAEPATARNANMLQPQGMNR